MQVQTVFLLAWRNIWRNRRRTILTLFTIITGSSLIIFMNAIAKGGHDQMIDDAVTINTGHLQIHEKGYWANRTMEYAFAPDPKLFNYLKRNQRIAGHSQRIMADALLSFQNGSAGAMIQAVDPAQEIFVSNLHTKILPGGRYLKTEDRQHAILGESLARQLGVVTGDTLAMISQGLDGSIAAEKLKVVGLFRSGNPEYDRTLLIMPFIQAKETFSMDGHIHALAIRLYNPTNLNTEVKKLNSLTHAKKLEILGWNQLMPELVQFIAMDDISGYIFDAILFLIVAFGILNTIQMSVYERTKEFGIMSALGTQPGQITFMILMESGIIAWIGIVIGLLLGYAISYYFFLHPIDYSNYSQEMAVWGIATTKFPADASALNFAVTAIVTFLLAICFSLLPALRAAKRNPVEAIRHH